MTDDEPQAIEAPPAEEPEASQPEAAVVDGVGAVLIIGGGISGMQAALDLADSEFMVYLLDKSPSIGGAMAQLDKTFPTNDCAMCIMAPKLVSTGRHHNVKLITNADLEKLEGTAGNFKVIIRKRSRYVDETKCTGCGICTQRCPIEVPDEYNKELKVRKAIYVKYPQAVPLIFSIDKEHCIGCGNCERYCRAGAIKYDQEEEIIELNVGSIILSPGFKEFDLTRKREYGYGKFKNVISSLELERMLSATGPYGGMVLRPSDGKIPKKLAFIQCVGSRDKQTGNTYCSSVCCMFAMKEAVIAQEHTPGLESTIFFMDMRAFGKEFDDYYIRAEQEHKIKFIRNNRIAGLKEIEETRNLKLNYIEEDELKEAEFELVVLSVGMEGPPDADELSAKLGVDLNEYGFCRTGIFSPLETNVEGIYVSGAFSAPKDIPDSVAQASGAAARATRAISSERGKLVTTKEYPEEIEVSGQEPRVGVFICYCGINIGAVVDVPEVTEYAKTLPGVAYAENNLYTCSQDTQKRIREMIKEHNLNRVVVASCTPRTHEPLFQNTIREAGLNLYLFEMTNIRDQCSWVHMHQPQKATAKAKDLVRMAVVKAQLIEPLHATLIDVTHSGLVIGGGLSGMTAALELVNQGFEAHLLEKEPELGGNLRNIYYTFQDDDVQAYLTELINKINVNDKVHVYTNVEIKDITGCIGNFKTTIIQKNNDGGGEVELEVNDGIVIVATGGKEYQPTEYLYGESDKIITQLELENILNIVESQESRVKSRSGKSHRSLAVGRQSNGDSRPATLDSRLSAINTVVMIQCVGSRTDERTYCSRVCCTEAVKNALKLKKLKPNADVFVLFKDMRTYGFREDYYADAAQAGVRFIRYDDDTKPEVGINDSTGNLEVLVKEHMLDENILIRPDVLVLSAATVPEPDNDRLSQLLKIPLTKDNFFLEAHMKLRPVDFATDGIFLCGLAHSPKFIEECVSQANGAVARASTILSKPSIESEAIISVVDEGKCRGCGVCVETCEFGAPELQVREDGTVISHINEALCKGCGSCAASCCNNAITTKHFRNDQILTMVEAALGFKLKGEAAV